MPVALVRGSAGSSTTIAVYPAFILIDANSVRWANTILPSANLDSTPTPSGPTGALNVVPLVLKDSNGVLWQVTISITGNLITTIVGSAAAPYITIRFTDYNLAIHLLGVSTTGDLVTT